jgi:hypothetical protein
MKKYPAWMKPIKNDARPIADDHFNAHVHRGIEYQAGLK